MRNDNQRPCLRLGHALACFRNLIDLGCVHSGILTAEELAQEALPVGCNLVSAAESDEEAADFRLEDDDERDDSHIQHRAHNGRHQPHVQHIHNHAEHIQEQDSHENAHGRRPPYPLEHLIYDERHQQNVKDIRK